MAKQNRTCFGTGMCLHIGPCCDFWADDGMCVCNPVDAASYPRAQRLYIAGNIIGFSSPNIRTIFPDGTDKVHTFDRGDYCWVSWDWGDTVGTVKFELRDGSRVVASRSTRLVEVTIEGVDYNCMNDSGTVIDCTPGITGAIRLSGLSVPSEAVAGEAVTIKYHFWNPDIYTIVEITPILTINGSEIKLPKTSVSGRVKTTDTYQYIFDTPGVYEISIKPNPLNMPPKMVTVSYRECFEGEKRNLLMCLEGYTIYREICENGVWKPTGTMCPPHICNEGEKRNPKTCWDRSTIYEQLCMGNKWVTSGETCPPKPECTEGDKKAGYVCVAGKWQPTVPEPSVEPVPEPVPTADGMFTIEFQELISGVKPPRLPLLIPGLETLPLLPGWIVRDAAGNIVNKGAELPTLQEIQHGG